MTTEPTDKEIEAAAKEKIARIIDPVAFQHNEPRWRDWYRVSKERALAKADEILSLTAAAQVRGEEIFSTREQAGQCAPSLPPSAVGYATYTGDGGRTYVNVPLMPTTTGE
jgi:hypothetical protein